eukprot:GSChrysophyteH1.ASY1.ANO1.3064.1 assembled CDS
MEEFTELERASVLAVESLLRNSTNTSDGDYTDEDMMQFLSSNCPRFEDFSQLNGDGSAVGSGKGIDVQMFLVHREYCEALESRILNYLEKINVLPSRFRGACGHIMNEPWSSPEKQAAMTLIQYVERYQDFCLFGNMMEISSSTARNSTDINASTSTTPEISRQSVRVLWDIENIPVPRVLGGLSTVEKITAFLRAHSLYGSGIDSRTTVFFNPSRISDQLVRELDSASVELVWISPKQEDADRKLVKRISQEMAVLTPQNTSFVLISSDKDFRSQVQLLISSGYKCYVIHNALHEDWKLSLEMHATRAFLWTDVVGDVSKLATTTATTATVDEGNNEQVKKVSPSKHRRNIERAAKFQETPASFFNSFLDQFDLKNPAPTTTATGDDKNGRIIEIRLVTGGTTYLDSSRIVDAEGEYKLGCVLRWKGSYGFLAVPIRKTMEETSEGVSATSTSSTDGASSHDTVESVYETLQILPENRFKFFLTKIYVHHHVLKLESKRGYLDRFELCRVRIGAHPKGPAALVVLQISV